MRPGGGARGGGGRGHGEQTIQYTLTPESLRDIDVRIPPPSLFFSILSFLSLDSRPL